MLKPLDASAWDYPKAAHLLNRAGFGGNPDQIEALRKLGFKDAVEQVLNGPDDSAVFPKPDWAVPFNFQEFRQGMQNLSENEKKEKQKARQKGFRDQTLDLVAWWLDRMERSTNPYREKLTLFWHGHFATSIQKVKEPYLMWLQNETLRQDAYGDFGQMVRDMSRDPAMMVWLDLNQSKMEHANENFARELMELFTLGIGNYTEQDIQQAAKAFTGYRLNPQDQTFRFAPFQHDAGDKTFFGETGNFSGDDIIERIIKKPACAYFMSKKFWEYYAYENPRTSLVDMLALGFQTNKHEVRPLLREIFSSAEFYSPYSIRTQIKSPVQWLVQTGKQLDTDIPKGPPVVNALRQLGQVPFLPPNVKGWDGGKAWITTSTLLFRYNLSNFAIGNGSINVQPYAKNAGKGMAAGREVQSRIQLDLTKIAPQELRSNPKALVANLTMRLFQNPLSPRETDGFVNFLEQKKDDTSDQTVKDLLHLMMSTPQYQLT